MTSNSDLRDIVKNITFMKMAEQLAKGVSYDPKYQVGALIVKNDWTKIDSMGYNGAYKGSPNKRFSLDSGQAKFICAETNAIIFSTLSQSKARKYTMFVTMTPCERCSRLIANKGIKNVVALKHYKNCGDTLEVFKNAGVNFVFIYDKIKDFYADTDMYEDVMNLIDEFIINPVELNIRLVKILNKQMDKFFEFNKSALDKLPKTVLDLNDKSFNKRQVMEIYMDLFANKLYELA